MKVEVIPLPVPHKKNKKTCIIHEEGKTLRYFSGNRFGTLVKHPRKLLFKQTLPNEFSWH